MREIKFRVWDKVNSRMGYFEKGFSWCDEYESWCLSSVGESIMDVPCGNNIIFMQFTGLKDKNGKEIYEGDILIDLMISPSLNNKIVLRNFIEDSYYIIREMREGCHFEVIGNIYENPGLIKEALTNAEKENSLD